jgi:hypothetical protein
MLDWVQKDWLFYAVFEDLAFDSSVWRWNDWKYLMRYITKKVGNVFN